MFFTARRAVDQTKLHPSGSRGARGRERQRQSRGTDREGAHSSSRLCATPRGQDGWACWAVAAFSIKPTQRTEHQTRTAPPCCHQQPAPQRNPSHAGIPRAPMADSHPLPCMTPRGMRWWAFPPAPSGDNPTTTMAATPSTSSRGFLAPKPASTHLLSFPHTQVAPPPRIAQSPLSLCSDFLSNYKARCLHISVIHKYYRRPR